MVGLRHLATRSPPSAVKSLENMSMKVLGCISLMSAPAAKALSLPANTMQPIASSVSRSSIAAAISLKTPKDSALSIFGRLSLTMPTAPLLSTLMCSKTLMAEPLQTKSAGNVPAGRVRIKWRAAISDHEHALGRTQREQGAAGNEDLADDRGLVPARAVVVAHRDRTGGVFCCCCFWCFVVL